MIFAIGEILIDFIAREEGALKDVKAFEKFPGGAPANVVVGLSRLSVPSALISKVGKDPFGEFLVERLKDENVETKYIAFDEEKHTGIVFVQLIGAKPEFILYDGVAYFNLRLDEIDFSFIENASLLHFGSVFFAREPSRTTTFETLRRVKGRIPISYDVNIRPDLWRGRKEEMLKDIEEGLKLADIVKIGKEEENNGVDLESFDLKLLAITKGSEGGELVYESEKVEVPAYRVDPIDTTGAGDAYMASLLAPLYALDKLESLEISSEELRLIGKFANIVAAISTLRRGAWSVPKPEELRRVCEISGIIKKLL